MIPHRTHGALVGRSMAVMALLFILAGCGGTSGTGSTGPDHLPTGDLWPGDMEGAPTTTREGCDILAGSADPGGHFVFTLTDSVVPGHAPIPRNSSERLVFAQLYESLVQVDCAGKLQPGLAASWTSSEDDVLWTFTLREGARFWDGSPVTPGEVRRAWGDHLGWATEVLDDRRLAVRLREPDPRFPAMLAHPSAAVAARRSGWHWPVGSGPCRLRASDPAPLPDLTCRPNQNHPDGPIWKSLTFRILPGTDPRDLVATEMDLTLIEDMNAAGFFEDAPGFRPIPLPWNRLYLLVCPPEKNPRGADLWTKAAAKFDAGRDVTAVSARTWPEITFPAGGNDACPQMTDPAPETGSARLDWNLTEKNLGPEFLVYPNNDLGAREMAHRLGALAGLPARTSALPAEAIAFALQWQMAGAFVIPLDQQYPTGCQQLAALLGKAAWLQKAALGRHDQAVETLAGADQLAARPQETPAAALLRQDLVRPLGLSRSWLVVRGHLAGLELTYDGIPLLAGLGRAAEMLQGEATP